MTRKTKYELKKELQALCDLTHTNLKIRGLLYSELQQEILIQKEILARSQKLRMRAGPIGSREIKLIQNEEGILVPVKPELRQTGPTVKRPVGRPRKDAKPPEEAITKPPESPVLRLQTLGADSDSDLDDKILTHVPPLSATRCTCLTCPVHNSIKRI